MLDSKTSLHCVYYQIFLTTFQSIRPKIHLNFSEMTNLLRTIMAKFVKSKLLYVNNNGQRQRSKNCKPLKIIDIGTKAKSCFIESLEVSPAEKKIRQNYVEVFRLLVTHLKSKLPLESTILKNCVYTHPRKKGDKKGLSAISNLTIELSKPLEGALSKVFPT